ncbi:MAG: porin, partial [Proteobacteria bacterium]|nr:porin [Pseudomonadota bacterium]
MELTYQAEMQDEAAGPSSGPASKEVTFREGFAGFQSPWGKMRVGRLSTPYKTTLTTIDPWTDNALQSRGGGLGGSSELHANFFNNTIEYSTAKLSAGISASIWHATELDDSGKGLYNTGTLQNFSGGSADGFGLRYISGPVFLALDHIEINADNIGLLGLSNGGGWQIAGRYSFQDWSFAAFYEDVQDIGLGKNTYINSIYRLGSTRLILAYGQNRDAAAYGDEDYDNWSIGAK